MVAAMICLGRRRSGVMQLDRLTVRRVEISLAPGFLPLADFGGRCRALKPDHCLERGLPLAASLNTSTHSFQVNSPRRLKWTVQAKACAIQGSAKAGPSSSRSSASGAIELDGTEGASVIAHAAGSI